MAEGGASARTDVLDVIVELLSELDGNPQSSAREFYESLCEAICRLASMKRGGLIMYGAARQMVIQVGSNGVESVILKDLYGTLEETPIAQVAFAEDRVVEVSDEIER